MKDFWQFVHERQSIYVKRRFGQAPPWTLDPILASHRFTNVFRELDPGTLVAMDIVRRRRPAHERLWNLILYRRLNREETWRAMGGYQVPWHVEATLRRLADEGPVFTGAHQVNMLQKSVKGRDAIHRQAVMMTMLTPRRLTALAQELASSDTARQVFDAWLNAGIPGVGAFLAWQLALDCNYGDLTRFSDDEWAPVQAGALAGLKIIYTPGVMRSSKSYRESLLVKLRDEQYDAFHKRCLVFNRPPLTIAAIEHSLCEYSKYHRIASGGHSKGRFA